MILAIRDGWQTIEEIRGKPDASACFAILATAEDEGSLPQRMNAKVEKAAATNGLDTVKLVIAGVLLVAGIVAYYYFADWNGWARIGVLFAGLIAAFAIAAFTGLGRAGREYLSESRFELRKVVWPTRDETVRTTLVIMVVVVILSLLLGLIDMTLKWVVLDHLLKLGH